jgi:hypothetical protein
MTVKQLIAALAQLAEQFPLVAPYARFLIQVVADRSEDDLTVLKEAIKLLPAEADLDAEDMRVYAAERARKIGTRKL